MSELVRIKLRDHISILSGYPFASESFSEREGIPLIRIRDLLSDGVDTFYDGPYPGEFLVSNGDLLVGMDGDFNAVRWMKGLALLNQRVCKILASTRELDQGFLFWILGPELLKIHRRTPQTTVRHLSTKDLYELVLEVPTAPEQNKIAQILDTLDTQIRQTEALIAKLERIKQGLLTDLLTRGIDQNGQLRPTPDQAPHLYKDSPLGQIPREWRAIHVNDIAEVKGGKRLPEGHDYVTENTPFKYLRVTDFFATEYTLDALNNLSESTFTVLARYEIRPGDLYISIAGSIGYVGVHRPIEATGSRTILTENAARLALKNDDVPEFLALAMNSFAVQAQIEAEKGTGGGVPKLALFRIDQLRLALPDPSEQTHIVERAEAFTVRISRERSTLGKLKQQKSCLMNDLLTGRVRVTLLLDRTKTNH